MAYDLWQTQVCVNAMTNKVHTETNCINILINVPRQEKIDDTNRQHMFIFNLQTYI